MYFREKTRLKGFKEVLTVCGFVVLRMRQKRVLDELRASEDPLLSSLEIETQRCSNSDFDSSFKLVDIIEHGLSMGL